MSENIIFYPNTHTENNENYEKIPNKFINIIGGHESSSDNRNFG